MRVAAAKLHKVVAGAGPHFGGNVGGNVASLLAVAEFVNVFHSTSRMFCKGCKAF